MSARRVIVGGYGGPEVLRVTGAAAPDPARGEALVRVLAAGVTRADLLQRAGGYPGGPRPPFVPGRDIVGIDTATGNRVAAHLVGGGYADHVAVPRARLVPVPAGVDPAAVVCLPVDHLTAYQMLHGIARVRAGGSVLVHGASGAVGTALLGLARLAGVRAVGAASPQRHPAVAEHGAVPCDRHAPDLASRVHELVPGGVDAAFVAGGPADQEAALRAVRPGGTLVAYGAWTPRTRRSPPPRLALAPTLLRLRRWSATGPVRAVFHSSGREVARRPERARGDLARLLELLAAGDIAPAVAARLPLEEAVRAHRLLEERRVVGKVVLVP